MKKKNIVITGGGTGGHIYPGLALVDYLNNNHPDYQVHFVGARGGLEEKIIPEYGHSLHLLKVDRLHKSVHWLRRLKSLCLLPFSFIQSAFIFLKLRPVWVLGIGGFASGPFVFTSSLLGGRTALLEPNAYPGLANRLLSKVVRLCFVVFKETENYFPAHKVKIVGLPVRIKKQKPEARYDGKRPFRVLVFGGSQGARAVNQVVGEWVESLGEKASHYKIVHQIGARDFSVWQKRYGNKHSSFLEYLEYINNMPERMDWADLIICRAGIGSVAEVAMCGKPAIFIPLPTAADNHQVKNAQVLANRQAAVLLEEKDMDHTKLGETIDFLRTSPNQMSKMMEQLRGIDYTHAQKQIIAELMGKVKK